MSSQDNADVARALAGGRVGGLPEIDDHLETHISHVFLAGAYAYKLKKVVKLPFLDFSTPALRKKYCEEEVRLNRRTAPDLYLDVLAVTRSKHGTYELDGGGKGVDWVVRMRRFDPELEFDKLCEKGELRSATVVDLAEAISAFHGIAEIRRDKGGPKGMAATMTSNEKWRKGIEPDALDHERAKSLEEKLRSALKQNERLLEKRRQAGSVRHCHGDLHLRNICLYEGRPTPFDCIEFNEDIACVDVLYDLAFLIMDLDHFDRRELANLCLSTYLGLTGDVDGLAAMPFFLAMRSHIRALVDAQSGKPEEAEQYLMAAEDYLVPQKPRLVAIGGLSGSGKSTLARNLAPAFGVAPGAVVVRSDIIRKRIMNCPLREKLGETAYTPDVTERVYATVYKEAGRAVRAGYSVIADCVFARIEERRAIAAVAAEADVSFQGLWAEADPEIMMERARARTRSVSDADASVVEKQMDYDLGTISWHRIDSGGTQEQTVEKAKKALGMA